ncbi:hypothetical protein [Aeoliella sp.]|uniref:hypothetical protein n=1 Tax=Aeoliella sp. TaxID=2795800 RepID=UPI003CCBE981
MNGGVDSNQRALLTVKLAATRAGEQHNIDAWVDTAFNGGLVLPRRDVARLGLKPSSTTEAYLTDGSLVEFATYVVYLEWFGETYRTQVVEGDGEWPLLATAGHDVAGRPCLDD